MITLRTNTPGFFNDLSEVVRVFRPAEAIEMEEAQDAAACIEVNTEAESGEVLSKAAIYIDAERVAAFEYSGPFAPEDALAQKRQRKHAAKIALYRALQQAWPSTIPWGSLTGVRPVKFARELAEKHGKAGAIALLEGKYDVAPQKAALALEILEVQQHALEGLRPDEEVDVYIGIPFCRSRCVYCSFSSQEYGKTALVGEYLRSLQGEMEGAAKLLKAYGKKVRSLYIGGGTPTALSCTELEGVVEGALQAFGENAREFTVEAGRPDTIDNQKLAMLKGGGVTRISINPQSMHAETLRRIGRDHTPQEILASFALAREAGFDDINMDVIAGLPGETPQMFQTTMDEILALGPESVTVHTLAIKRGSPLRDKNGITAFADGEAVADMLSYAEEVLRGHGHRPYYLYRQKYMNGNLENTGYALPGKECLYNIDNMDEQLSVLALGYNAITKWIAGNRIERQPNPKDLATYMRGIDGIIEKKTQLLGEMEGRR